MQQESAILLNIFAEMYPVYPGSSAMLCLPVCIRFAAGFAAGLVDFLCWLY